MTPSPTQSLAAAHQTVGDILSRVEPEYRQQAARLLLRASAVALAQYGGREATEACYRLADELAAT